MKTIFTVILLAAITTNALAVYSQVQSHPQSRLLAESKAMGYNYEVASPYSKSSYNWCMEEDKMVFLETSSNNNCGKINNSKWAYCKAGRYCNKNGKCVGSQNTSTDKKDFSNNKFLGKANECIAIATQASTTIPKRLVSMPEACTDLQAKMLNPTVYNKLSLYGIDDSELANLASYMLRAHCIKTQDYKNSDLANSDIKCEYNSDLDDWILANNWSAAKWTTKYNQYFDGLWYNCNENYKAAADDGTADGTRCKEYIKDLVAENGDYCPTYFNQAAYDSCMVGHELGDNKYCGVTDGVTYYCAKTKYKGCKNNKCLRFYISPSLGGKSGVLKKHYKNKVKACKALGEAPLN